MNEKFYELPSEKRQRMIDAGLEVFGAHDYVQASTDEIAAKAGIAKGLLFYYFKNKKEYYLFLFDYCCDFIREQLCAEDFDQITDFFDLMAHAARIKYSLMLQQPSLMNTMMRAYSSQREEVSEAMKKRIHEVMDEVYDVYFSHIDFSRFKADVDPQQILKMLTWMADGYILDQRRHSETLKLEAMMQEYHTWLTLFRKLAYKEREHEDNHKS